MNGPFFVGIANLDRFEHTFRKPGRSIVLFGQFRLHASDHDRIELLAVGGGTAGEPLVVKQFEQCGETFRVAVVRRGRQKQLVFKMRNEQAKGVCSHRVRGITADTRGSAVVGFIEDQQIELAREGGLVWTGQEFTEQTQRSLTLEEVDAGDEPWEVVPRIDVDTTTSSKQSHHRGVHDTKVEAELVPHLFLPLNLERGGADDQDLPSAVTDDKFECHHARFDRFAQAHVIGDQEVDPWHLDRTYDGIELVVFDVDTGPKWSLDRPQVCRRRSAPADGIEKGVECIGWIDSRWFRQRNLFHNPCTGFQLPNDTEFFSEAIVFHGGQSDQVLRRFQAGTKTFRRKSAGGDVCDHPIP